MNDLKGKKFKVLSVGDTDRAWLLIEQAAV